MPFFYIFLGELRIQRSEASLTPHTPLLHLKKKFTKTFYLKKKIYKNILSKKKDLQKHFI